LEEGLETAFAFDRVLVQVDCEIVELSTLGGETLREMLELVIAQVSREKRGQEKITFSSS
jgi:hypothetical protein